MARKTLTQSLNDKASQLHARFVGGLVACFVLLLMTGIGFNLLGGGWLIINQIIGIVSVVGMSILFSRFQYLLLGVPLVSGFNKLFPPKEEKDKQSYIDLVGHALLIVSIAFMFLGTWSAQENPSAIPAILLSLIVLGLMMWKWESTAKIGKTFAHVYAFGVLIISMASIFPGSMWIKYTGHDPRVLFVSLSDERAIYKARIAVEADRIQKVVEKMEKVERKAESGNLDEEDLKLLEEMERKRDARTLPAVISGAFNSSPVFRKEKVCVKPDGKGGCRRWRMM